ncbi:hypothetical protein BM536_023525 [Streptomyces phaeoluteigriseus]|uniref:Uncharacterized protein n=1 Tax=Streptomyces phaeoluteigriseus TaxID=114686 RepID=A0A1V6MRD7_9ACTN|nr:hypothetical protein [Streptomyces phaeoluteigriseus]OQD54843.1 hypothetical protein BM536_023525 [Streptomyces phaeoluteigriseus]
MRIRSALAVAVLGVALAAAGATSAAASDDHHRGSDGKDDHVCSPYFGGIETVTSRLVWGGADCRSHAVGHDN